MIYDNNSTDTVKYVESNLYVSGKGPTRWFASTTAAHKEMWGPAVFGMNRVIKEESESEPPVGVTYEKCTSADEGALMVIADGTEPVGKQINISTVKPSVPDIEVGQYVKPVTI